MKKFGDKLIGFIWGIIVSLVVFDVFSTFNIGFLLWLLIILIATIVTISVESYLFITDYENVAKIGFKAGKTAYNFIKKSKKYEEEN